LAVSAGTRPPAACLPSTWRAPARASSRAHGDRRHGGV